MGEILVTTTWSESTFGLQSTEYLVFIFFHSLKMREKYIYWDNLVFLSLYIFWGKCVYFSIFE